MTTKQIAQIVLEICTIEHTEKNVQSIVDKHKIAPEMGRFLYLACDHWQNDLEEWADEVLQSANY